MELWSDFSLSLTVDDILRGEGADPTPARARSPALLSAAETALQQGHAVLKPLAAVQETAVREHRHEQILLEGGKKLTGALVSRHLAGAERVAAVVCTIGPDIEEFAAAQQEAVLMLALDGLANAAIETVAQQVCARLGERAQARGLEAGTPLSPGETGWPVQVGQPQIFALLEPHPAGVHLAPSGMMSPLKSLSFVVGIGPNMAQADLCALCSFQERCRYRNERISR
jgi:hypothetical protein